MYFNMSDAPAAAPVAAVKAKTPKKKAAPKKAATHPTTAVMVAAAIAALKDKRGSGRAAIKKYIAANYKVDILKLGPHLKKALKTGIEKKTLVAVKGSFKLGKVEKVKKVKKVVKKKPAKKVKKAKTPKKAAKPAAK